MALSAMATTNMILVRIIDLFIGYWGDSTSGLDADPGHEFRIRHLKPHLHRRRCCDCQGTIAEFAPNTGLTTPLSTKTPSAFGHDLVPLAFLVEVNDKLCHDVYHVVIILPRLESVKTMPPKGGILGESDQSNKIFDQFSMQFISDCADVCSIGHMINAHGQTGPRL